MTVQHNFRNIADSYIEALGGKANIESLVNCATRIRVIVKDPAKMKPNFAFLRIGAISASLHGNFAQIVIGLDVPQVLEAMHSRLDLTISDSLDEYGLTPNGERARILYECLGLPDNIQRITVSGSAIIVQVADPEWVDPYDVMLQLNIGVKHLTKRGGQIRIEIDQATAVARELNRLLRQTRK
ncbi:PTS transporter subunit EIIB [Lacticaseibacillus paracasei]|jgi:glucose-like phosphotransferase system IIB component|uniref:PTS system, glucose-like IIB component domain protein n=1 Tax=Lacticaseibacillus paracasei subsp. paracasei Lpp71 TaxID=1256207 RepID=A0A8E0IQU1_LACPA|nr:PTS transporter subunit EIIB [Lacticaseibacillus paracasei]EPC72842.1 PTS system, glucose-like IIB component domain protein [Lacticaseibacillus paracasei subsp. paracasei Lpp71]MCT3336042.1 PTS sugar transporter subunit IIBC [Lacticaseibacillus paracasei]OSY80761.1 PTS sugar transporter subunit IIBC [Lacticaseibacillus paracasei]RND68618.1 PTS system maltose-specific EIICB component [Lacticaseibacillus paracasei]